MNISGDRRNSTTRTKIIFLVLMSTFLLTGFLAYQAIDAIASHKKIAENTLDDYTNIAAWELTRLIDRNLHIAVSETFNPVIQNFQKAKELEELLPDPDRVNTKYYEDDCLRDCPTLKPVLQYFAWNITNNELHSYPISDYPLTGTFNPDTLITNRHRTLDDNNRFAILPRDVNGTSTLIIYTNVPDRLFNDTVIIGFEVETENFTMLFEKIWKENSLLPEALIGNKSNDDFLYSVIYDTLGNRLFEAGSNGHNTTDNHTLDLRNDGIIAAISLLPGSASHLVIGGLPRNRFPLLAGLFILSFSLMIVAYRQFRKESELAKLRSDFVSGVSHELRTPIAQIRMFIEMLLHNRVRNTIEKQRAMEIIDQEAKRLTYLVENILQFSRTDRNIINVHPAQCDLDRFINDVLDSFRPIASANNISLCSRIDEEMIITTDLQLLRQIIVNLLDNAVKYSPENSRVIISTCLVDSYVQLIIDDEGPGIPHSERIKIWKPYTRLDRDINGNTGGSGIGLAVVAELTQALNGKSVVEDSPNGGARFIVELPVSNQTASHIEQYKTDNIVEQEL